MSSGSTITTGPGVPVVATCSARSIVSGHTRRVGNFDDPFRDAAEHLPVVDLLEGVAAQVAHGYLADQQEERHRVLLRRVHGDRGVAGAGSAADAGDAGPMRQPRIGQRHKPGAGLRAGTRRCRCRSG